MRQEFTQEIKNIMEAYQQNIHTVLPGEIVAFDAGRQEATVKPTAKFWKPDAAKIDYPDIFEVPVFFIQGMGQEATITHAVKPGDECMVIFFEQALDQWRTKAESDTDLRFDISNAAALVGFFAGPNRHVKRAYENESIIIQRGNVFVELFDKKIEIYADGDLCGKADVNINMEAGVDVNVTAKANITIIAKANTAINTAGETCITTGGSCSISAGADVAVKAAGALTLEAAGGTSIRVEGDARIEADGNASVSAGGNAEIRANGSAGIRATTINLN